MAQQFTVDITPELEKRLANIESMLARILEPVKPAADGEFLTGIQFMSKYHMGKEKLWKLVDEGKVEFHGERGGKFQRFKLIA
jgi:hypothetical protein